ncbi:MAG TPA: DUF1698 domain-containing protein [Thermoanaerobaculia bacterium]|nr:DUF1698 domain-containing protein [Thermoanaerobaculia bacterium]
MDERELRQQIESLAPWYHNVELAPGVWTNPARGNYPQQRWRLIEPWVPEDLSGKTVLDLSCNSGYFAAMMKRRGAERVVGIDIRERNIEQARLVTAALGVDVELRHENVYRTCWEDREEFDFVLFLGLFYHLRSPLFVLDRLALRTRERLFLQTVERGETSHGGQPIDDFSHNDGTLAAPGYPAMLFVERCANGDPSNWWFPNRPATEAILRSAGFASVQRIGPETYACDAPANRALVPRYDDLW